MRGSASWKNWSTNTFRRNEVHMNWINASFGTGGLCVLLDACSPAQDAALAQDAKSAVVASVVLLIVGLVASMVLGLVYAGQRLVEKLVDEHFPKE
jgi:hypothetical protein